MAKIAYFSDLHLEHSNISLSLSTQDADIIVLAGDIYALGCLKGKGPTVIDWIENTFRKPVVFVPGNHDIEAYDVEEVREIWKIQTQKKDIHFLWNESVEIMGVRFLGTPLFTNFSSTHHKKECMDWARRSVYEFSVSMRAGKKLIPEDYEEWFYESYAWLDKELSRPHDKTVVVTHFSPDIETGQNPHFPVTKNSAYWTNNCPELVEKANAWISGHTHYSHVSRIGQQQDRGLIVSNARGYSDLLQLSPDPNFSEKVRLDTDTWSVENFPKLNKKANKIFSAL